MAPSPKTKSRIALGIALIIIATVVTVALYAHQLEEKTVNPLGSPYTQAQVVGSDGFPEIDWDYWLAINSDIIGWITIPGTNIDTPIVQAQPDEPGRYLWNDIYGNWNYHGAAYLSAECIDQGLNSPNAVIYAHNMGGGSGIFAHITNYTDFTYATEHNLVLLQTPTSKRSIDVCAVEIVEGSSNSKRTDFASHDDLSFWYQSRLQNATISLSDSSPQKNENIVSLVTCSYNRFGNERTIIYAHGERI